MLALQQIGADKVIFPEYEVAKKLAENLVSPNILEEIELSPIQHSRDGAPKKFWGKSIRESDIRPNFRISVIAISALLPLSRKRRIRHERGDHNVLKPKTK